VKFRWLGVAGIELVCGGERLVIDPYLTRAPVRNLCFGRVKADGTLLRKHLPSCDHVLISHAHFDHVMDAAEVLRYSGAAGFGSANACRLMVAMGAPSENVHMINRGDHLECGPFRVEVHPQGHPKTPIDRWINADLRPNLEAPLRLMDYRMDESFAFLIQAGDLRVLVGDAPTPADVFFTVPWKSRAYYARLVSIMQPKVIIPIHWDYLFIPLAKILRWTAAPSKMRRFAVEKLLMPFKRTIGSISCTTESGGWRILIPQMLKTYELKKEMLPAVQPGNPSFSDMSSGI
jgi:L-ascorbate metabolism protein UlaG (beta-lactamase superfamily)